MLVNLFLTEQTRSLVLYILLKKIGNFNFLAGFFFKFAENESLTVADSEYSVRRGAKSNRKVSVVYLFSENP